MHNLESRVTELEALRLTDTGPRACVLYPGGIQDACIGTLSRGDVQITRRLAEPWSDFTARAEAMSPGPVTLWVALAGGDETRVRQK